MRTVVYSVPGTGTRFVCDVLERVYGYRGTDRECFETERDPLSFILIHAHPTNEQYLDKYPGSVPFVLPLRHPCLGLITRMHVHRKETAVTMAARWRKLIRVAEGREHTVLFPIDTLKENRRALIDKLGECIEEPVDAFAADCTASSWMSVGESGKGITEKAEFLMTGKVRSLDLLPLADAVTWYQRQLRLI